MCKNATATASELMAAIEPTVKQLLALEGLANTPDGIAAINAFDAAQAALAAWTPGTTAQTVIEAIDAFTDIFNTLPIPAEAKSLAGIISAGIVVVISVITGNSPAPAATTQAAHEKATSDAALKQVQAMIPGFHVSMKDRIEASLGDHSVAAREYKGAWNKEVATVSAADPKYAALKAA